MKPSSKLAQIQRKPWWVATPPCDSLRNTWVCTDKQLPHSVICFETCDHRWHTTTAPCDVLRNIWVRTDKQLPRPAGTPSGRRGILRCLQTVSEDFWLDWIEWRNGSPLGVGGIFWVSGVACCMFVACCMVQELRVKTKLLNLFFCYASKIKCINTFCTHIHKLYYLNLNNIK